MANSISFLRSPIHVWWDITYRCNFRCIQCYSDAGVQYVDELSYEEVVNIIGQLVRAKVFYVYFLGGEPFIRSDFLDILDKCNQMSLGIMISTNGWFITPEVASRIENAGVSHIRVSIDGATATTHDTIRRKRGSFQQAWRAVSMLQRTKIPTVGISCTVMESNFHEVEPLVEMAIKEGVKELQLVQLCCTGRGATAQRLSIEHLNELRDLLSQNMPRYHEKISFSATEGLWEKPATTSFRQEGQIPYMMGCIAGRTAVAISADGLVLPCIQYRKPAGNLRKQLFEEIWQFSPVLNKHREVRKECEGCRFNQICGRECPADPTDNATECRLSYAKRCSLSVPIGL